VTNPPPRPGAFPQTRASLAEDLRRLGVGQGDVLLVHASLRSLGYVVGGSVAVVQALFDAVGRAGTVVVPAQTATQNREPSRYDAPSLDEAWWPLIREHLPAFDPAVTPSEGMGAIAERIRLWPGAARSAHPQTSFAAVGPRAPWIVERHDLDSQLGEASPLARLEAAGAKVLLLGVGYDKCTAFHLAEYRLPDPPTAANGCAVMTAEGRRWVTYVGVDLNDGDFSSLGVDFDLRCEEVRAGQIGEAAARLFPIRAAVSFAVDWLGRHRKQGSR
jgi:aminoglycoside 3-N-acetyltransferase